MAPRKTSKPKQQPLVADSSFVFTDEDGVTRRVIKGKTTAHGNHPVAKLYPDRFKPLVLDFDMPLRARGGK